MTNPPLSPGQENPSVGALWPKFARKASRADACVVAVWGHLAGTWQAAASRESGRANLEGWEREGRGGEGRRGAGGGSTPLHTPHKEEKKVGVYTAGFPSSWKSQGGSNAGSAELSVPHPLLGLL